MAVVLQGNMHRSRAAHDLQVQICSEKNVDIMLVSEQYRDREGPGWYRDELGTAAIWVPDPRTFHVEGHGRGKGFVWVRHRNTHYISVYLTPNQTTEEYKARLDGMEDAIREMQGELLVAGDFNAKAVEWGEGRTDTRGRQILEMASRLELIVLNTGTTSTFRRPGYRETIIDISLASGRLAARTEDWRVIEDYTASDHQYIMFRVRDGTPTTAPMRRVSPRWNLSKINLEKLSSALEYGQRALENIPNNLSQNARANEITDSTMRIIEQACAEAVPRKTTNRTRRPAYWWTSEIADLRKRCLRLRRESQRTRRRNHDATPLVAEFRAAKKNLKWAIKASQRRCWKLLGEEMNKDPWGLGYKIVLRRLGAFAIGSPREPEMINNIVDALFPTHPKRANAPTPPGSIEVPKFSERELSTAVKSMKNGKAPGPDGLPAELLKAIARTQPSLLLDMFNSCLRSGIFPARWKTARLVLISKGKGKADSPFSYRPLCMLDTTGKLLEKLLKTRLLTAIRAAGDLAPRQYGFRRGLSTIDAVQEVVDAARSTESGNHYSRPVCLLVTLDVKNSVSWEKALCALKRDFKLPEYLLRIIGDYLADRSLVYDTYDGPKQKQITSGAAQGSILGRDIWNAFYDGILRMDMPENTFLVGYADDIAAVITAKNVDAAQLKLNQVMRLVNPWMEDHGLELAAAKTEIVLLTKKRINTTCPLGVGAATVGTTRSVKYLGVTLDNKLTFGEHIRKAADRAAAVIAALSKVMANTTGPRPCKRRLLMRTAESIMLYGAEVWAGALRRDVHRRRLAAVQRRAALRIACSYRTVSEPAVLVVAGVIPIDLLARERLFIRQNTPVVGRKEAHGSARAKSLEMWQDQWRLEPRGRWTARLIREVAPWFKRQHGEVNFYVTQFLTGHGLFYAYLHKMGKTADAGCIHGDSPHDDALHTFFVCEVWSDERRALQEDLGEITPDNIIRLMLEGEETWAKVCAYIETILRKKKKVIDERDART